MAGLPWIKVWTVVPQHPKVQRLERELHLSDALGMVVRLWCWTASYHPGGDIPAEHADGMAEAMTGDILSGLDRSARNARVTQACVTCGFLDPIEGGFRVHDWHDMQTTHVEAEEKRKAQARDRQARFRSRHSVTGGRDVTRDVMRDSVTEKEKEREIRSGSPIGDPVAPRPSGSTPSFASMPVVGSEDFAITEAMVAEWASTFPALDVKAEVLRAAQWCRDNPAKRKTARGARAFLGRWLGKAQDDGRGRNGTPVKPRVIAPAAPHAAFREGDKPW